MFAQLTSGAIHGMSQFQQSLLQTEFELWQNQSQQPSLPAYKELKRLTYDNAEINCRDVIEFVKMYRG